MLWRTALRSAALQICQALARGLRALFKQDKREDPIRAGARKNVLDQLVKQLSEDRDLLKKLRKNGSVNMTLQGKAAVELDKDDLRSILNEAVKILTERPKADQ